MAGAALRKERRMSDTDNTTQTDVGAGDRGGIQRDTCSRARVSWGTSPQFG